MPAEPIRVAVWGVGDHARKTVLPAIDACSTVSLAGLSTRNEDVLNSEAAKWSCPTWSDPLQMLEVPSIDAVYLATPIGLHLAQGLSVLRANKDLWCEKALTATYSEAEELVGESQRMERAVCAVFAPVHHNQFKQVRELMAQGRIGRARSVSARFGFPHLSADNIRYNRSLAGGVLLDVGFYPLNMCRRLLGHEPAVHEARMETEPGYEVDTSGSAQLHFPGGITASLEWGYGRDYQNELEITGELGSIFMERAFSKPPEMETVISIRREDGSEEIAVPPCDQFVAMLTDFAAAVREPARVEAHRKEALAQQHILEQVKETAK